MNALDVMKYGHFTVLGAVENLPEANWADPGVCGYWTTRDIIAHLASYELVLADVLAGMTGADTTPLLDHFLDVGERFNDDEVDKRQGQTVAETLAEYTEAYERAAGVAARVPEGTWREAGTLPWYGSEYSLDDWIVYQFYGHKREHCAQIAVFRDTLSQDASTAARTAAG